MAKALRRKLDPKDESCCFTCFLPTRLCKGGLQTEEPGCFLSDLLIIFWSLCRKAWEEKGVEMDIPFVEGSGFAEGWSAKDFGNVR
jgi:hypothetical protein